MLGHLLSRWSLFPPRIRYNFTRCQELIKTQAKYQLFGLLLLDRGVLRSHQKVSAQQNSERSVGEITSGGFSPTLNSSIALARLSAEVSIGDEVQVLIRDKALRARIVKYPFVRNGKSLI